MHRKSPTIATTQAQQPYGRRKAPFKPRMVAGAGAETIRGA